MRKLKAIVDYIPKPEETKPVMGEVPVGLLAEAKKLRGRDGLTWNELLTACLRRYVDEGGHSKGKK